MTQTSFVDKFVYPKDKESPQNHLKGRFFVWSTLLFFLLCLSSVLYYSFALPEYVEKQFIVFVFNLIFSFGILCLL